MCDSTRAGAPTACAVTNPLTPVGEGERIDVLDVLRGFALFGVLWANLTWYFSGYGDLPPDEAMRLPTAALDPMVLELESFFVVDKFISIFSFLFGVGFALQMRRASEHGTGVRGLYVRRMLWLFIFGAAHALLIWFGDILHLYAVLGLLLIGWVTRGDRTLIGWGLAFAILVPVAVRAVLLGLPYLTAGAIDPAAAFETQWKAAAALKVAFAEGSYAEVIRANAADVWAWFSTDDALTKGLASFGKFLLGFWAGRTAILVRASASYPGTEPASTAITLMHADSCGGLRSGCCVRVFLWRTAFSLNWMRTRGRRELEKRRSGTSACSRWRRPTSAGSSCCSGARLGAEPCASSLRWAEWPSRTT